MLTYVKISTISIAELYHYLCYYKEKKCDPKLSYKVTDIQERNLIKRELARRREILVRWLGEEKAEGIISK